MSENYLQHADHFTRVLNEQENYRKQKFAENKSTETETNTKNTPDLNKLNEKEEEKNITEGNLDINSLNFFSFAILSSSNFIFLTSSSPPPNIMFKMEKEVNIIISIIIRPPNRFADSGKSLIFFR